MTKAATFDLSALAIVESTVVHLTHPATDEKLYFDEARTQPVTITVASTSSRAYRQAVNAMNNRTLKRGSKKPSSETQREEGIELLTACCLSAENLVLNGSPVKTEADFRALLANDSYSWIKGQIDEALGNVELFIA